MNDELLSIIDKYLNGEATEQEREMVDAWYSSFDSQPGLTTQLSPEELANQMTASFVALTGKLANVPTDINQKIR